MIQLVFQKFLAIPAANEISMYINIGVGILLALAFLFGYIKGIFKSTYQLLTSLAVVVAFYLLVPTVTNLLLTYDLSSFGINLGSETATTIEKFIGETIVSSLNVTLEEGVLITDTLIYKTIVSVFEIGVTIVMLLLAIILNITLFKLIFWIIYLFIKPRKKDENGVKIKKKFISRLSGGLINTLSCVLSLLILFVPLSAVLSLGETASSIVSSSNEGNIVHVSYDGYNLKLSSENKGLLETLGLDQETLEIVEEYGSIYRDTIPGVIYSIKIQGTEFDTFIFDKIFEIDNGETTFSIRKELNTVLEVVGILDQSVEIVQNEEGSFNIFKTIESLSEEEIETIFNKLSELEIIRFVVPVALETAEISIKYKNVEEGESADLTADTNLLDLITVLKDTDYKKLIGDLGNIVRDVKGLYDSANISLEEGFNYDILLNLDETKLQNVLNSIGELTIIDELYSVVISSYAEEINGSLDTYMVLNPNLKIVDGYYYINDINTEIEAISEYIEDITVKINDEMKWVIVNEVDGEEYATEIDATNNYFEINLSDIVITDEIKNIGNIYSSFKALGVTSIDSFKKIFDDSIEAKPIDYSKFTYDNLNNISKALLNSQIISKASGNIMVMVNNMLPNEYHNMITIPRKLEAGDLTSLLVLGKVVLQSGLISQGESIDYAGLFTEYKKDLLDALKGSDLITNNLTPIVGTLLSSVFGENIVVIPEDLDWGLELEPLFDSVELLLQTGAASGTVDLEKVDTDALALALSKSRIITGSMNGIIKFLLESVDMGGLEIKVREDIVWDYNEIHSVLESAMIVLDIFTPEEGEESADFITELTNLSDDDIDTLLSSKLISSVMANLIYDMASEGGQLEGILVVKVEPTNDAFWLGTETSDGELVKLLRNAKLLMDGVDLSSEDVTSDLLNKVINLTNNINPQEGETDEVGQLLDSKILSDTIIFQVLSNAEDTELLVVNLSEDDERWLDRGEEGNKTPGEIRSIFSAINIIFGDEDSIDLGNINLDLGKLINLTDQEQDQILESVIIVDTAVDKLKAMAGDEKSVLVVVEEHITDWKKEIKTILSSAKIILLDDGNGNYDLENTDVDLNKLYNLEEDEIDLILSSEIMMDTMIVTVVDANALATDKLEKEIYTEAYIKAGIIVDQDTWQDSLDKKTQNLILTSNEIWRDKVIEDEVSKGEIHKLLNATGELIEDGSFNVDNILHSNTNIIFDSRIMLDTFYYELHNLENGSLNGIILIKDGTVEDKTEAVNFVEGIKVIIYKDKNPEEVNITTMGTSDFDMNIFTTLTDDEINKFTSSNILRYSGAKQAHGLLTDTLSDYILLKSDDANSQIIEVENDLANLICVLRDLKEQGIDYNNDSVNGAFNFDMFETALSSGETEEERNSQADGIADTMTRSIIITQSLNKMFTKVLSGELNDEQMEDICGPGKDEIELTKTEWVGKDESDIGELKRLLRIFTSVRQFSGDAANNSNITNTEEITKPLKGINHSLVLHGLLPSFVDTALDNVKAWKSGEEPSSVEEWDSEIDTVANLVVTVNDLGEDLGTLSVYGENAISAQDLGVVLRLVNKSIILDINKIKEPIASGVKDAFSLDNKPVIGNVYPDDELHWNIEIDNLVIVIERLQAIEPGNLDISEENNARVIGQFLDACRDSVLLSPVVNAVLNKVLGPIASLPIVDEIINSTDYPTYESKLVAISEII